MEYAISVIPTKKLYMGLPTYGYDWDLSGEGKHFGRSFREIEEISTKYKIKPIWDKEHCEFHFNYTTDCGKPKEIWFSNKDSFSCLLDIVLEKNISGISIWVLADEDPGVWNTIVEKLKT
ncbi:MAG: glycosyl hydrolase family 18 protein [Candidatus Omnitrophica bacterium]|nr:glycosyl hydrolase family 18 protein [Candidatus Omnitrophota bacterium]